MAKLEIEVRLDAEALVRELKEAAEKIEAEKKAEQENPAAWLFNWRGIMCSKCRTVFSDELVYMNREHLLGDWTPMFCPECGAKLVHEKKEASE